MKKVIASIVLYKHSYEELKPTLDSLLSTSYIEKIILVDNDNSSWANHFIDSKIVYLKSPDNLGFGYGNNLAINKYASDSQYFLICNPDIIFESTQFEKLVNFADTENYGLFFPRVIMENGHDQYAGRLLPTPLNLFARRFSPKLGEKLDTSYLLKNLDLSKPSAIPAVLGCFMLFKSKSLLALNGFDDRYFMYLEDIDLSRRCHKAYGNCYFPLATVTHLHEQGSYKSTKLLKIHIKSTIQYFNKWGWFFDKDRHQMNEKTLNLF